MVVAEDHRGLQRVAQAAQLQDRRRCGILRPPARSSW
jgi:hypothetical protein